MFTGLIEEVGTVRQRQPRGAVRFTIEAQKVARDLKVDDSITVNGVCLTAVAVSNSGFEIDAVQETLDKTTLGRLHAGSRVNLERALRFSDRLGGHIVQGHVDSIGHVTQVAPQESGKLLSIRLPTDKMKYVIPEGSITVDGVSLTVARIDNAVITIALIPHTLQSTTLDWIKIGDQVNIEVDLIGKYVESILLKSEHGGVTEARLRDFGYHP